MAESLTFDDILAIVQNVVKSTRGSKDTLIEYLINQVYLGELISSSNPLRPFYWLLRSNDSIFTIPSEDISGITSANPGVVTANGPIGSNHVVGNIIEFTDIGGMTELNGRTAYISAVAGSNLTIDIDTSGFSTYTSGGKILHKGITSTRIGAIDRIFSAGWNGYTPPMVPISAKMVEEDTTFHNEGNSSRPEYYLHTKNFSSASEAQSDKVLWYPSADDTEYRLRLWYIEQATRLSTTKVPLMPFKHHEAIPAGVITRLIENKDAKVRIENASMWPAVYKWHIDTLKAENEKYWDAIQHGSNPETYLL